jgi:UDP-N-acetyl-D-galactosamine dehydrogenase
LLELITITNPHIAIIGLGNIGLPLVMALGEKYPTVGFDIDA